MPPRATTRNGRKRSPRTRRPTARNRRRKAASSSSAPRRSELWKTLADDFPDHKVINRGFGGTEIVDSTHFADRLIFPHEPKQIFLRAGGNDIHAGRLPREVAADFAEFVRVVHARLPKAEILFIGLSPAPRDGARRIRTAS